MACAGLFQVEIKNAAKARVPPPAVKLISVLARQFNHLCRKRSPEAFPATEHRPQKLRADILVAETTGTRIACVRSLRRPTTKPILCRHPDRPASRALRTLPQPECQIATITLGFSQIPGLTTVSKQQLEQNSVNCCSDCHQTACLNLSKMPLHGTLFSDNQYLFRGICRIHLQTCRGCSRRSPEIECRLCASIRISHLAQYQKQHPRYDRTIQKR